jgi:hypothetical protein
VFIHFPCSTYSDSVGKYCGLICITVKEELEPFSFLPFEQIDRYRVWLKKNRVVNDIDSNLTTTSGNLAIDPSEFMGFFESPIEPTYHTRSSSFDHLFVASKAHPRTVESVR